MAVWSPLSDGRVVIRPGAASDAATLVAGRDDEFHRFLGPGADDPRPTACIVVDGEVVGWVDYDFEHDWLEPGEINVGYFVFAAHRGNGYAPRAVELLLHHLAADTAHHTATLLIHPDNVRSVAVARRTGFSPAGEVDGSFYFTRPIHPD